VGATIVFNEINREDYPGETIALRKSLGLDRLYLRCVPSASTAAYCLKGE
jgi:hypothetical protein